MPQPDLNGFLSPASFWTPDKIVNSAWLQHGPFAFWIVEALKPRTIVELGTHHGFSYLAFCQAVRRLALPTKCFAVDTWQGDEHAGRYSDTVYTDLKSYHDPRFSDFSRMVRLRFDEAAKHFADGSVDLLHVDGRHFYEDAKEDYETWLPKLSDRAVVLFHDTNVRERNFGVWRLWEELSARHPGFEFVHGHGLGVLGVGQEVPQAMRDLFKAAADNAAMIRETYYRLGLSVQDQFALQPKPPVAPKPAAVPPPAAPAIVKPAAALHIHLAAMAPRLLDVRTYLPLRELAKVDGISVSSSDLKIEFPKLPPEQPKVMIMQRLAVNEQEGWLKGMARLAANGWVAIVEADDHPDLTNKVLHMKFDELTWSSVRLTHAVQTSTELLAAAFRQHNPEVAVFRNATFTTPVVKGPRFGPGLRVFYGALNRENYSAKVGAALAPFAAANPDVAFVVVHDRAFFDALGPCNKTYHPTTASYDDYAALMAGCDVCLMPLEGQSGELFKSDLKFVESSSLGLASIASVPVYGATISDGVNGLIAEHLSDWPRQLDTLYRHPKLLEKIAGAAQDYVRGERQFSQQIGERLTWYRDLWSRRVELNQALLDRVTIRATHPTSL